MKKVFFVLAAVAALSFSTSSCKKCGHCEVGGQSSGKICSKDSKTAYDLSKTSCEGNGGTWVTE